jgi:hypothetical protein
VSVTILEALRDPALFGGTFDDRTTWAAREVFLVITVAWGKSRHGNLSARFCGVDAASRSRSYRCSSS